MARSGPKSKDSIVIDNPNLDKKLAKQDLHDLKILQMRIDAEGRQKDREIEKLRKIVRVQNEDDGIDPNVAAEDIKSAYQMLQDMRYVYQKVKGRAKLEALVKSDDKQFAFLVKELMRIESALKQAEIRKEGTGSQDGRAVFVILKGLEQEQVVNSGEIDFVALNRVLDPNAPPKTEAEKESVTSPELLLKTVNTIQ